MFGKKTEQRKERSDKRVRVNLSLSQEEYRKLKLLSIACCENSSISPTGLASEMVHICLNSPEIINWLQRKYQADTYRVVPVTSGSGKGVDLIVPR